jgi:hypothetical protein
MSTPVDWIPIEWPAAWGPKQVALLGGTPFNAITSDKPLPAPVADAARAAGIGLPEVRWSQWKDARFTGAEVTGISEAFWPAYSWKGVADGSAGPTGEPWLDANGWLYLYARSRAGAHPVWLRSDPPKETATVRLPHLQLLLVEAFAYGGRHTMWLPPEYAADLAAGVPRAVEDWNRLSASARWLGARSAWHDWSAVAPLVLISDFSADHEYVAGETMLLAARQRTPFWPIYAPGLTDADLRNRRAALYLDPQPPAAKPLATLYAFAMAGGLVLAGPELAKSFGPLKPVANQHHPRFDLFVLGRGRVALARKPFDDPWTLAEDAHLLTSRRYDPARLFNGGLLYVHTAADPAGGRSVVHVVNYGTEPPGEIVALQISRPIRSARFHVLGANEPQPAKIRGTTARPEVVLPYFGVYVAVELEHAHA